MESRTKCRTIVETLGDEILAGRYRAPMTFPSVERIVRRFADTSAPMAGGATTEARLVAAARSLVDEHVSGILFHPVDFRAGADKANHAALEVFRKAGVPVVLLDCDIVPPPGESGYGLLDALFR